MRKNHCKVPRRSENMSPFAKDNQRSKLRPSTQEEETENASEEIKIIHETCLITANQHVATGFKVLQEVEPRNMSTCQNQIAE
jgi:hypothetical protein